MFQLKQQFSLLLNSIPPDSFSAFSHKGAERIQKTNPCQLSYLSIPATLKYREDYI